MHLLFWLVALVYYSGAQVYRASVVIRDSVLVSVNLVSGNANMYDKPVYIVKLLSFWI